MKEYTILAASSIFITIAIDKFSQINLLKKPQFYIFLLIIFGFKILVNGYLTATEIVMYNPAFYMGLRIGSIPLEDFFFGFSMVTLTIIFWEYFLKRQR